MLKSRQRVVNSNETPESSIVGRVKIVSNVPKPTISGPVVRKVTIAGTQPVVSEATTVVKKKVVPTPSTRGRQEPVYTALTRPDSRLPEGSEEYRVPEAIRRSVIASEVEEKELPPPRLLKGDNPEIPRKLRSEEIEYLLQSISTIPSALREVGQICRDQIRSTHRVMLTEITLAPSKIPELYRTMRMLFIKALIEPGKTIGVTTAEAFGQPTTQMTLSSFHQTGDIGVGDNGLQTIREMFNVSPVRKHSTTVIHFRDKHLDYEDVMNLKRFLVGINISHLILEQKTVVNPVDEAGDPLPLEERPEWYSTYREMFPLPAHLNDPILDECTYLELRLDAYKLYKHQITVKDVVDSILENPNLDCVADTFNAVIHVYPIASQIREALTTFFDKKARIRKRNHDMTDSDCSTIYFEQVLKREFREKDLRGIPAIYNIVPSIVDILLSCFKAEEITSSHPTLKGTRFEKFANDRVMWQLWIDPVRNIQLGIPVEKYLDFFGIPEFELEIISHPPTLEAKNRNRREDPHNFFLLQWNKRGENLLTWLKQQQSVARGLCEKWKTYAFKSRRSQNLGALKIPTQPTPEQRRIYRYGHYVYAKSLGINMLKVLTHPLIDPNYSSCNNPHEMLLVFGIENARNFYMIEFNEIVKSIDGRVATSFFKLLTEFVTNQGFLNSLNSQGASRQTAGWMALASFEHSKSIFINASMFSNREVVGSTSTSIFVGARAPIGTGSVNFKPDTAELHRIFKENRQKRYVYNPVVPENQDLSEFIDTDNIQQGENDLGNDDIKTLVGRITTIDQSIHASTDFAVANHGLPARRPHPVITKVWKQLPPFIAEQIRNKRESPTQKITRALDLHKY